MIPLNVCADVCVCLNATSNNNSAAATITSDWSELFHPRPVSINQLSVPVVHGNANYKLFLFWQRFPKYAVAICCGFVNISPSLQVVWRRTVGDHHAGGAAVPGSVQRAGSEIRHGGSLPGPAGELPREDVSKRAGSSLECAGVGWMV